MSNIFLFGSFYYKPSCLLCLTGSNSGLNAKKLSSRPLSPPFFDFLLPDKAKFKVKLKKRHFRVLEPMKVKISSISIITY